MALEKPITQSDGVVTNYHRIVTLFLQVNGSNSIELCSYVNKEYRDKEREYSLSTETEFSQPYTRTKFYTTTYDESMTITTAYEYLKTLPEFEGSIDV